ncbi:MAG: bifunctional phosphoribosylaminoimidazolecarboxamide formyltransferase/IMP cyclohydrolase [Clostridiales bacterium]|jgi:phosphoribosylaminoimidazolecarboxamide formyltransferase/IMP cyclohydrolase|nr:bifunctional phosphoribosylaminoimidazolecarboxamide formyltransferase/IMP cyclohydrolase [Clostridiales bacterium]
MAVLKSALLSVSDKTGIIPFARALLALGYRLISTGGTYNALKAEGLDVVNISEVTGFPECLDGRVKTLHPAVHAGLLARRGEKAHMEQLKKLKIDTIDVVAVNLYPFKQAISDPHCTRAHAVENIDIGGPTKLRSAAKNYQDVVVVTDPSDYAEVVDRLKKNTADEAFRLSLMYKVFAHTAEYDTLIAAYLRGQAGITSPDRITYAYEKVQALRYGENPHQSAVFYKDVFPPVAGSIPQAEQLNGKELSFNNIGDANGAIAILKEFSDKTACVAVKHANPCGVAVGESVCGAFVRARDADPISIFGGIVAFNRKVDAAAASELVKIFLEIVIAPDYDGDALAILKGKPNLRVLRLAGVDKPVAVGTLEQKRVLGGLLVQDADTLDFDGAAVQYVTKKRPDEAQMQELGFAYKLVKHVKSNAIVITKDGASVGIGVGQTNRIWAAEQAIEHGGKACRGAVLASDAFFPFPDCVEAAAKAGIVAIIQPGGAKADADSIAACDKHGIAMVFVGTRHFKH